MTQFCKSTDSINFIRAKLICPPNNQPRITKKTIIGHNHNQSSSSNTAASLLAPAKSAPTSKFARAHPCLEHQTSCKISTIRGPDLQRGLTSPIHHHQFALGIKTPFQDRILSNAPVGGRSKRNTSTSAFHLTQAKPASQGVTSCWV